MRGFPVSKFQDRLIRAQPLMAYTGLNALFLSSEAVVLPLSLLALRNLCEI
mgnify:CR=1 FL=1|tara:strand:- start:273 stop:425 length:153 start_codon:yes stop_codon:yes gene_type:complete